MNPPLSHCCSAEILRSSSFKNGEPVKRDHCAKCFEPCIPASSPAPKDGLMEEMEIVPSSQTTEWWEKYLCDPVDVVTGWVVPTAFNQLNELLAEATRRAKESMPQDLVDAYALGVKEERARVKGIVEKEMKKAGAQNGKWFYGFENAVNRILSALTSEDPLTPPR